MNEKTACIVLFKAFKNGKVQKRDCLAPDWITVGESPNFPKPDPPRGDLVGFSAHMLNFGDADQTDDNYIIFRWFSDGTVQKHDWATNWQKVDLNLQE